MKKLLILLGLSIAVAGLNAWEGDSYAKTLAPGKRDAFGAVSRLGLEPGGAVLDVGCGDGGITALIAERFSESRVVGVDFTPSMIDYANRTYGSIANLSFREGDARRLGIDQEFDLIVSFGVMHWIKDQADALASFNQALKPEGKIFIQFPLQLPGSFHDALQGILFDPFWKPYFVDYEAPWTFYHLGEYLFFLYDAGFSLSDMRVFVSNEEFLSREAFQECLGLWLPFVEVLPDSLKGLFLTQLVDRYIDLAPFNENGHVLFQEPLLEVECIKLCN